MGKKRAKRPGLSLYKASSHDEQQLEACQKQKHQRSSQGSGAVPVTGRQKRA